ncbi:MAG: Hsp33 family molecular chaperone HslO [Deltaproteobacteria bacterium]|nr:Hsp33 family molecular chaperone HslO [Deltaproteobacteria bacterium]
MNTTSPPDKLFRAVSEEGGIAVRTLIATELTRAAAERHQTSPLASAALGRALMGTLLVASRTQDGETVQMQFKGNGPIGAITTDGNNTGQVRGFVGNPSVDLPLKDGRLDVASALGIGLLTVDRNHPTWKEPYRGVVHLVSSEIAEDITYYLSESEQNPAAVGLGIALDKEGRVEAAAGFLVQALPGVDEDALTLVENNVLNLPNPTDLVRAGKGAEEIAADLFQGIGIAANSELQPIFHCHCNRERITQAMSLLGREELRAMAAEDKPSEIVCHFCNQAYTLSPDELRAILPDA